MEWKYKHFETDNWKQAYYPLLLQRTIEGINTLKDFEIIQTRSNVVVYSEYPVQEFEIEPKNEDEAKEQALKYIY